MKVFGCSCIIHVVYQNFSLAKYSPYELHVFSETSLINNLLHYESIWMLMYYSISELFFSKVFGGKHRTDINNNLRAKN